jgi:ABC-type polysaccharide/polyol phosphate transport system ATPase subunit
MSADPVLEVAGLGKCYRIYRRPADRLRQAIFGRFGRRFYDEKWALRDVTFTLRRGTALGIIGRNGAGKSTLLQIIAGTLAPTTGTVRADGRVVALLELGSGFNPEFTGRENVFLYGALYGLSRADVERRFDAIAAFADIGPYLDRPIKTYSTGMGVRLAFAVIAHLDPDVLIVDEALAVGDVFFQHKCMRHIGRLLDEGTTLLFASHGPDVVKRLCQQTIWIADGAMAASGASSTVVEQYLAEARMDAAGLPAEDAFALPSFAVADPPQRDGLPLVDEPLPDAALVCRGDGAIRDFFVGERGHPALVLAGSSLVGFRSRAAALELVFGAHAYGGYVGIDVDGTSQVVNLYSPVPRRVRVPLAIADRGHAVRSVLIGVAGNDPRAKGADVWFLESVRGAGETNAPTPFKRSVAFQERAADGRYGVGGARITFVELLDATTLAPIELLDLGITVTLRIHVEVTSACPQLDASFIIRNREGHDLFGTTAHEQGLSIPGTPGLRCIDFTFENRLRHGSYSIHVALASRGPEPDRLVPLDVVQIATVFQVTADPAKPVWYVFDEPVTVRTSALSDVA